MQLTPSDAAAAVGGIGRGAFQSQQKSMCTAKHFFGTILIFKVKLWSDFFAIMVLAPVNCRENSHLNKGAETIFSRA